MSCLSAPLQERPAETRRGPEASLQSAAAGARFRKDRTLLKLCSQSVTCRRHTRMGLEPIGDIVAWRQGLGTLQPTSTLEGLHTHTHKWTRSFMPKSLPAFSLGFCWRLRFAHHVGRCSRCSRLHLPRCPACAPGEGYLKCLDGGLYLHVLLEGIGRSVRSGELIATAISCR